MQIEVSVALAIIIGALLALALVVGGRVFMMWLQIRPSDGDRGFTPEDLRSMTAHHMESVGLGMAGTPHLPHEAGIPEGRGMNLPNPADLGGQGSVDSHLGE